MIFDNPAGLWSLLSVLLVVLLFIFKPKYSDHYVSTNYLWRLSREKHRRKLSQSLTRGLIFLLQLLTVLSASLLIAQPRLTMLEDGRDYIMLLDNSASMRLCDPDGKTALDRACEQVLAVAEEMPRGSTMTILTADEKASVLLSRSTSVEEVAHALQNAACTWSSDDETAALTAVQDMLTLYPASEVRFYTDHGFARAENLTVVNVSSAETWNVDIADMTVRSNAAGITVRNTVICHGPQEQTVAMALYVDDRLQMAQMVTCPPGEPVEVRWHVSDRVNYRGVRVYADAADALAEDNEAWCWQQEREKAEIIVVSSEPYYINAALDAFGSYDVDWADPISAGALSGYDLYIYDGCLPVQMPGDGVVCLMNPPQTMAGTDVTLGETLRGAYLSAAKDLKEERYAALLQDVHASDIAVLQLREATAWGASVPIMMCGELPIMLAGEAENGAPVIWMLFDLHHSNLPLLTDYLMLMRNIVAYAMPEMLDTLWATVGESVPFRAMPFCQEAVLTLPDGKTQMLSIVPGSTQMTMTQPGVNVLTQRTSASEVHQSSIFVHTDAQEMDAAFGESSERTLLLSRPAEDSAAALLSEEERGLPLWPMLAALLFLCLMMESVVYHREQV